MNNIEKTISNLIENQFPAFYKDEGPMLIAFIQAYYEWMETSDQVIYESRRLPEYADIDDTVDEFIKHFKSTYLTGIQFDTLTNKRLLVKNILDIYRSKGTPRAIELLFKLVFGEEASIYFPAKDIFKASDGKWKIPKYLEITHHENNTNYNGRSIVGATSGATAFVDHYTRKRIDSKYVDIFFITAIQGDFIKGEKINLVGETDLTQSPTFLGCLNTFEIIGGGELFDVGDVVTFTSNNGIRGKARVTNTSSVTGLANFTSRS